MSEPIETPAGNGKQKPGWIARAMRGLDRGGYWLAEKFGFSTGIGIVA